MAEIMIRKMTLADIEAVLAVDKICFTAPWTKDIYEKEVRDNDFAHYFVIELEKEIIGYIGIWIVMEDAQITNIAILPKYRGYGIGKKLFGFALQYMTQNGAAHLSLEVRVSNHVAQSLYESFGLQRGGIRKNYYPDNGEDAFVMWVNLHEK